MLQEFIEVGPEEARIMLERNVRAGLITMLHGSPSLAKTSIIDQMCQDNRLKLIDVRAGQLQPEDLLGYPRINPETGKSEHVPFDFLPLENDPVPPGYDGWCVNFDEFNVAEDSDVEKACLKILNEKMVGQFKLHPNIAWTLTGNLVTDGARVRELTSSMKSRVVHLHMGPCLQSFLKYERARSIDHRISSYLEFMPKHLYTFDPKEIGGVDTYSCYRTWRFTHKLLQQVPEPADDRLFKIQLDGILGEGVSRSFVAYLQNFSTLPKIEEIVRSPDHAVVPEEPGPRYAICGAIGAHVTPDNMDQITKYVSRLPEEFQIVAFREIVRTDATLISHPACIDWSAKTSIELY